LGLVDQSPANPVTSVAYRLVRPFWCLFQMDTSWRELAYYLFGGLWTVAIWSLVGGVISRIAAVQLGREERITLRQALDHGRRKWTAHLAAVALPLLAVAFVAFFLAILGLVMRLDLGVILAGLVWPLVLLAGLLMALLLLALVFGWPLMWGTIGVEASDAFDAISRAYAYTLQRPLHYLFYALVAAGFGVLGWLVVWGFSEAVIALGWWGVAWGASPDRVELIRNPQTIGAAAVVGSALIALFDGLVRALATGFAYSYFWSAGTAVYLLLRRDADHTEMDDVFLEEETGDVCGMPPLETDEAGVPVAADETSSADPTPAPASREAEGDHPSEPAASPPPADT
jgi:hypothetical protein